MALSAVLTVLIAVVGAAAYELPITRSASSESQNEIVYTVPITLNKQPFQVKLNLSEEVSWVKGASCKLCTGSKCDEKCSGRIGPSKEGMVCSAKKPCTKSGETVNTTKLSGFKFKGEFSSKYAKEPWEVTWVAAEKIYTPLQISALAKHYDGQLNLFDDEDGFVFDHFSFVRTDKEVTLLVDDPPKKYLTKTDQKITLQDAHNNQFEVSEMKFGDTQSNMEDYKASISLNTRDILLPEALFNSLANQVITQYDAGCTLKNTTITCNEKVNITKLKDSVLEFKLAGQLISIPFMSLVVTHDKKQLMLLLNRSSTDRIVLGEALLKNFALTFDMPEKTAYLARLDNQWSKMLQQIEQRKVKDNTKTNKVEEESEEEPHKKTSRIGFKGRLQEAAKHLRRTAKKQTHEAKEVAAVPDTIGGRFFASLQTLVYWLLRIILVVSLLALVVNAYHHRRHIRKWLNKNLKFSSSNLMKSNNNGYSPAFQEEIDPTPSIAQGYDAKAGTKEFWEENSVEGL